MVKKLKYYFGKFLYSIERFERARDVFMNIDNDSDWKVKNMLAKINQLFEQFDSALNYLDEAMDLVSEKNIRNKILKRKINILRELGKENLAIEALEQKDKRNSEALNLLIKIYLDVENLELAEKYAEKLLEVDSSSKEAFLSLGDINHKKKNYDQAIEYYNKALEISFNNKRALEKLFNIYFELDKLEKCKEYLNQLEKRYSEDIITLFNKAKYLYKSGDLEYSYDILEKIRYSIEENDLNKELFFEFYNKVRNEVSEEVVSYYEAARKQNEKIYRIRKRFTKFILIGLENILYLTVGIFMIDKILDFIGFGNFIIELLSIFKIKEIVLNVLPGFFIIFIIVGLGAIISMIISIKEVLINNSIVKTLRIFIFLILGMLISFFQLLIYS